MNILFVGKKDIAGRYTAEKLFKEGNKIYWLTDLKDGELWQSGVKGNIYRVDDLTSEECRYVFTANSIDIVFFMTDKHREYSDDTTNTDFKSIIPSLKNILTISMECKVRKFVLFSSIELYRKEITSPILLDLSCAEMICQTWSRKFNMTTLILRVSCICGVYYFNSMDYIGEIYNRMKYGELIKTQLSKEDKIDIIFGQDFAEAVYRFIYMDASGVYEVFSGNTICAVDYFKVLSSFCNYDKEIIFSPASKENKINYEVLKSNLLNGWKPFYNFNDNIEEIIKRAEEYNKEMSRESRSIKAYPKKKSEFFKYARELGENILLFIISCILLRFTQDYTDFRFVDVRLIYVVIISCAYGMKQGITASFLSCISYGYSLIDSGIDLSYLLYSIDTWTPFVMYIIVGSSVGYIIDSKNDKLQEDEREYEILDNKYTMLKDIYDEVCGIKNQLQKQIMSSKNSFGRVYEIINELDTFEPELIYFKAVNILEDVMETNQVSIYTVNPERKNYARLISNSIALSDKIHNSIDLNDYPLLKEKIYNHEVFMNKYLLEGYPTYAAPIVEDGKVIAIAMTYHIGLERFTMYYQNLFTIVIQMIQNSLIKADKYSKAVYEESYIPGTIIYNSQEFKEQMKIIQSANREIKFPYIVGQVKLADGNDKLGDVHKLSQIISRVLRRTDFIGCDENNRYYAVLTQTSIKNLYSVLDRLNKAGIDFKAEEDI